MEYQFDRTSLWATLYTTAFFALIGKLFNLPVGVLLSNLNDLFRGTSGLKDPLASIRNHPSHPMIVQYPYPRHAHKKQPNQEEEKQPTIPD